MEKCSSKKEEIIIFIIILLILSYIIYIAIENKFFKSPHFFSIKDDFLKNATDIKELNSYIDNLTSSFTDIKTTDYGQSLPNNIYGCSLSVIRNAKNAPFKYICKYFNIPINEDTLMDFNKMFDIMISIESAKDNLTKNYQNLVKSIKSRIPWYIRLKAVLKKLDLDCIEVKSFNYPKYTFKYVSPGGKKTESFTYIFTPERLESFIHFLDENIKYKKSAAGQRALMTKALREKIKKRDNYTCQECGNSIFKEPNLLLEIDHIIPISKGGLTVEDNLQTLCWKCNRHKGNKM